LHLLTPGSWKWDSIHSERGEPPEPRIGHAMVAFDDDIYVYGGAGPFNKIIKQR